ncbi:MAG: pyruvate kinase [Spirochaetes bacterium]|nr:pyruvate kinase [Spirochaetota bacterium]
MNSRLFKKLIYNRTKIVATLGPASRSKTMIRNLILEGVDVFRLNFSHGSHSVHLNTIQTINAINKKHDLNILTLVDLQGPKIRVEELKKEFVLLEKNKTISIVPNAIKGDQDRISITYHTLYKHIKRGEKILIDDGKIELSVLDIKKNEIKAKIKNTGILTSRKGVNLPNTELDIPSITDKDKEDIKFCIKNNINIIALSFVREKKDITALKQYIKKLTDKKIIIIAKIEKPQAVKNIIEIVKETDGIMVARGDLGVEVQPEKVPLIQKKLIKTANKYQKFVITATQMLESMINNPTPTRAETTDVFNAVIDGTDAVMLSGETTIGKYPLKAVQMMNRILKNAENYLLNKKDHSNMADVKNNREQIADSIFHISKSIKPKIIISFTNSGQTAQILSKTKPSTVIIAFTPDNFLINRLSFYSGLFPVYLKRLNDTDSMIKAAKDFLFKNNLVKKNDKIIISLGIPIKELPHTNSLIIYTI